MIRQERTLLDRSLPILAAALVLAIVSFGVYYFVDGQGEGSLPTLVAREISRLEDAVRAEPDSFTARVALARTYETSGRYSQSLAQYEAAEALSPGDAGVALGLARVLLAQGDHDAAKAWLEAVVEERKEGEFAHVDSALQEAYYFLGEISIDLGDFDAAIAQLEAATAIDKADADSWYKLCQAQAGAGQHQEAVESCRRAVLLVPDFAEPYEQMAVAYKALAQPQQARYASAMRLFAGGEYEEAAAQLRAVIADNPEYWDAYVGLGLALESNDRREEAMNAYQQALDGDPENFLAMLGVARLGGTPSP